MAIADDIKKLEAFLATGGQRYVYEGKTYNTEFAVTKNSTTLPNISGLTGTATYVPATNKLKIDVRFSTPEC